MEIHLRAHTSNLVLCGFVLAKHKHPNILRCEYRGGLLNNTSYGVLFERSGVGILLIRYVAVNTHFP